MGLFPPLRRLFKGAAQQHFVSMHRPSDLLETEKTKVSRFDVALHDMVKCPPDPHDVAKFASA